ncbi:hypothetical protein F4778DRAFT_754162 [Xylariomycetidae sp. FL2044]|nr:hypothetical protein F4778DRAFT_754162 [Xylariomycetidae sp. FL2044]
MRSLPTAEVRYSPSFIFRQAMGIVMMMMIKNRFPPAAGRRPILLLRADVGVARILADAGVPPDAPFEHTPLDFVEKGAQKWERRAVFRNFDLERQDAVVLEGWSASEGELDVKVEAAGEAVAVAVVLMVVSGTDGGQVTHRRVKTPRQRIPDDAIMPAEMPLSLIGALVIPSMVHSCASTCSAGTWPTRRTPNSCSGASRPSPWPPCRAPASDSPGCCTGWDTSGRTTWCGCGSTPRAGDRRTQDGCRGSGTSRWRCRPCAWSP